MDNEKLLNEINQIRVDIAEIKQTLKYKNEYCLLENERINKLEKLINGNGSPGIRTQVFILWGAFLFLGSIIGKYLVK